MRSTRLRADCSTPSTSVLGWLRSPVLRLGIVGLMAIALPTCVPSVALANDYETCAADLQNLGGIAPAAIAGSCAGVLRPVDLSSCVVRIKQQTNAQALDALSTCLRVRRPIDLATCVVDISRDTQTTAVPVVLDSCRRSLLPVRFSECVIGLNRQMKLEPINAMDACIEAGDIRFNALN